MSPSNISSKLKEDIKITIKDYSKLLESISDRPSSEINEALWKIRAELETEIIEIKSIIKDSMLKEKWQETFHLENKGTKSKDKAISKLKVYSMNEQEVITLFVKNQEECYRYLWKLKETISSVISAFPETRYKWVNNQLREEKEEIFEI